MHTPTNLRVQIRYRLCGGVRSVKIIRSVVSSFTELRHTSSLVPIDMRIPRRLSTPFHLNGLEFQTTQRHNSARPNITYGIMRHNGNISTR